MSTRLAVTPEEAFRYLTEPDRYVEWMGSEAALDPVPGGTYRVRMPDGFHAAGTFLHLEQPHEIVFTWGFPDPEVAGLVKRGAVDGNAMPAGSTRVTVTLNAEDGRTRLTLRHENLPTVELRDGHRLGWETYLHRLAIRTAGGDPGPDPHS